MSDNEKKSFLNNNNNSITTRTEVQPLKLDFDKLLTEYVGQCGRFQMLIVMSLALMGIPCAFTTMEMVFLTLTPEHWCDVGPLSPAMQALNYSTRMYLSIPNAEEESDSYVPEKCSQYDRDYENATEADIDLWMSVPSRGNVTTDTIQCSSWVYDENRVGNTLAMEFSLVCSRKFLVATSQSIHMAGVMLGTAGSGLLADRIGRKPVFVIGFLGHMIARFIHAFSVNYIMYCMLRFLIASFSFMLYSAAYVMCLEYVGPKWRVRLANIITFWWGIGCVLLTGIAYFVPNWSPLILVVTISCVLLSPTVWFVPESPRWLYVTKRTERADAIMKLIAKRNKTKLPENYIVEAPKAERRANELDLFRTPRMRIISLVVFFLWFVSSFVYYGLSLASPSLGGNIYLNYALSSSMEVLCVFFCVFLLDSRLGRMWTIRLALSIGGAGLLLTLAVGDNYPALLSLTSMGKFAVSASFNIVYLLAAEMFPTVLRTVGLGLSSMCARIGAIIAPFVAMLGQDDHMLPILVFGGVCLAGAFTTFLLPETRGQRLPETVVDVENRGKNKSQTVCVNGRQDVSEKSNPDRETFI